MSNNNGSFEKKFAKQDLNQLTISGNLGRVNDLKFFDNGQAVLNFSLASGDDYTKGTGDSATVVERTVWVDCAVYGKYAEGLNKILRKWKSVTVVGRLQSARGYSSNNTIAASNVLKVENVYVNEWKDKDAQTQPDPFADVVDPQNDKPADEFSY